MSVDVEHQRNVSYRRNFLWAAALIHRISGIALACFLPLHFLVLGLAIEGDAALDGFLSWTQRPLVKLAEAVLVFLLVVHLLGGLRVLAIENLGWRPVQKVLATAGIAIAALIAVAFLIRAG